MLRLYKSKDRSFTIKRLLLMPLLISLSVSCTSSYQEIQQEISFKKYSSISDKPVIGYLDRITGDMILDFEKSYEVIFAYRSLLNEHGSLKLGNKGIYSPYDLVLKDLYIFEVGNINYLVFSGLKPNGRCWLTMIPLEVVSNKNKFDYELDIYADLSLSKNCDGGDNCLECKPYKSGETTIDCTCKDPVGEICDLI